MRLPCPLPRVQGRGEYARKILDDALKAVSSAHIIPAHVNNVDAPGRSPHNPIMGLRDKADEWDPLMPLPNAEGNYPAVEALRVSLARSIIRHRRRLGLTQAELARKAKIRPETLNRIEHAKTSPSVAMVDKIERALKDAAK
jgi:DNA-binding XRE family transcriptional regulator